jgi:predicted outer membrane repeat protein
MEWDSTVVLHGNIMLSKTLVIGDGKEHTIDLNGFALDRSAGKTDNMEKVGSVIWVHANSKLIIKDSSKDKSGEICGGNASLGGGICVSDKGSTLIMTGGNITMNNAPNGGGIFVGNGGTAELTGVTVAENNLIYKENDGKDAAYGGGLHIAGGAKCVLKDCLISSNYDNNGGGISNTGTINIENTEIKGNQAKGEGAGIFSNGKATLTNSTIFSNMANSNGGGISNKTDMTMEDCTISNNSSSEAGGGIFAATRSDSSKTIYIGKNKITQNNAKIGGGIYIVPAGNEKKDDEISNILISDNYASEGGGGIYVGWDLKEVIFTNVTIK